VTEQPNQTGGAGEHTSTIWIDDREHVVEQRELLGRQIKDLAGKPGAEHLFLEQTEIDDVPIRDDEVVQIRGGEHFRSTPLRRAYRIFIDETEYVVESEELTGAEIKKLADKPADYKLFLERPGQPDKQIADDERVHIKDGEHFHTVPPATFG
jgi:hypothetical protein